MSRHQDGSVRFPVDSAGDELSWPVSSDRDGERLRAARDGTHLSTAERVAYALSLVTNPDSRASIGRSEKQLKRYADGDDVPLSVLTAISALSGLPVEWIVSGRPKSEDEVRRWLSGEPPKEGRTNMSGAVVVIPSFDVAASAGAGAYAAEFPAVATVDMPAWVLDRLDLKPTNARVLSSRGISMLPTIGDGDRMIVDTSKSARMPVDGSIYVLSIDESLLVKRLRMSSSGWILVSDNREMYPEEPIPPGRTVTIHGQVKWVERKLS